MAALQENLTSLAQTIGADIKALNTAIGAIGAGDTAGAIWGSDGTDGVIVTDDSLIMSQDPISKVITLKVGVIDGGSF